MFLPLIRFLRNEARDWTAASILVAGVVAIIGFTGGRWLIAVPLLILFVGLVVWLFFFTEPAASARDDERDKSPS